MNSVVILVYAMFAFGTLPVRADPFVVTFYATFTPHPVSPEGFVDDSDKDLVDSVPDLRKALDGQVFDPKKGFTGSRTRYVAVTDPAKADIVLTIAARGTSSESFGQRTTLFIYRGVVLADTVNIGTRWVSVILSVGTYRKEFIASSANSVGGWKQNANLLADILSDWVMANQAQIRALRTVRVNASSGPQEHSTIEMHRIQYLARSTASSPGRGSDADVESDVPALPASTSGHVTRAARLGQAYDESTAKHESQ